MSDVEAGPLAPDACSDCDLATGAGCCGETHGTALLRSDRVVLTLSGIVVALLTLAILTPASSRHAAVLAAAVPTLLAAVVVSALGAGSLRRPGEGPDRLARGSVRVLPLVAGGLVVTAGIALVRSVLT